MSHGGRVANVNRDSRRPRLAWNPPDEWFSGDAIPFDALGLRLFFGDTEATRLPRFDFDPADRVLWAGPNQGGAVRLTVTLPSNGRSPALSISKAIRVNRRDRGTITWNLRPVWGMDETVTLAALNPRTQYAAFGPPAFALTAPPAGRFAAVGDAVAVSVQAAQDDYYLAKSINGTVKVVADIRQHASDTAEDDMRTGRSWTPDLSEQYRNDLADYEDDVNGVKTDTTRLMTKLLGIRDRGGQRTRRDFLAAMRGEVEDAPGNFHEDGDQIIWNVSNYIQVRYKKHDPIRGRCFVIEGKTVDEISVSQDTVAFKVMDDGNPAPKGPGQIVYPDWVRRAPGAVRDAYLRRANDLTHIKVE